ncbi:M48 family metallopeptidase [Sphingomonas sp. NSE70-1]|uniref:M48 family metallopeptidase n=1 Tax=Sphingomonas caseinilyticus TaxID=2908205 RepID=A0ABT0RUR3_9SPHN|nr:M48 family metallopeptidase [Sphingomonas caseinilyticus]MCL6698696.1 M48 family metallopeptidase [Sphingomonas caseinilyticus]
MNVEAATARYIDGLGAANLEKAAAYTNGNHWILLWNLVVAGLVTWLIVKWGLLDRIEKRIGENRRGLRAFVVGLTYFVVSAVISLPWTIYEGWYRESSYGRTSQPIGDFLFQTTLSTLISSIVAALFLMGIYWLIRRTGKRWWLWSGGLVAAGLAFIILLSPVLIEPLFNKYEPVPAGEVRDAVVEMAGRAGIPPEKIYMFNGSRQSNNFTANAGGVGSTARVAISDVALKSASLDEVRAVTGHEIGHYVLKHTWYGILFFSVAAIVLFWLADRLFPRFARAFGSNASVGDPRGLPVLMFMGAAFMLLISPLLNSFARTIETQADVYSLETENKPDGLASALVKTAEYRYPRPSQLAEILFYDHPSVENRVRRAMQWKADHPPATGQ